MDHLVDFLINQPEAGMEEVVAEEEDLDLTQAYDSIPREESQPAHHSTHIDTEKTAVSVDGNGEEVRDTNRSTVWCTILRLFGVLNPFVPRHKSSCHLFFRVSHKKSSFLRKCASTFESWALKKKLAVLGTF